MKFDKAVLIAVILLLILIPIGFYTKIYNGYGDTWVNNKLGGIFYEIFWCLLFFILLPKTNVLGIVIWVFVITCVLEFIQLTDHYILENIRSNFIGQSVVGNSFTWSDFPYYILGSAIGYLILNFIKKYRSKPVNE